MKHAGRDEWYLGDMPDAWTTFLMGTVPRDDLIGTRNVTLFPKGGTMQNLAREIRRFLVGEDGPTAVEYAVMLALIIVASITIITSLGSSTSGTFSTVNDAATS